MTTLFKQCGPDDNRIPHIEDLDVRTGKVLQIKKQIKTGTYEEDPRLNSKTLDRVLDALEKLEPKKKAA
jgi:anti-sigma28 factor (negative regulator of flagellin synthesis)